MYKVKQKLTTLLMACFAVLVSMLLALSLWTPASNVQASAESSTVTMNIYANKGTKAADSSSISWTSGDITFLNEKAQSTTAIRTSDADHYRVYAKSKVTISTSKGTLTKIVVTASASSYTDEWQTSAKNAGLSATISGNDITITPTSGVSSISMTASAQMRLKKIAVTYELPAACTHPNTEWSCTDGQHKKFCSECGETIEGTSGACEYDSYTYVDNGNGSHNVTSTCTICNIVYTENETCELTAEYVRNGNTHTQVGTCNLCGASTSVTENCTLIVNSYQALDTDNQADQQHAVTTTCSICEQTATANEACSFDEGVVNGASVTYTCEHCEYSYTEGATLYTVTYVVPNGLTAPEAVQVAEGFATELPSAPAITDYAFLGWVTEECAKTNIEPEHFEGGSEYTVTEDVTLYALYSYTEGNGGKWTKVTDANKLAVGEEIVIVASGSNDALGTNQASNNRTSVTISKSGNEVILNDSVQIITLEEGLIANTWAFHVTGGTGTNAANGYLYAPANGNYLRTQTSINNNSSWSISINDSGVATIKANVTSGQNWLRKNSNNALFSCYNSGQNDISIYMKDGAVYYMTNVEVPSSFDGANVTIGEEITLNYYVNIAEGLEEKTTVIFSYNEKTIEAEGVAQADGRYKYSVELAPQYMTVNVNAKIYFNGKLADEIAEYSIATYAYNKLNDENSSNELKRLVSDMLYYGAAAQNYKGYNTDNLASNVAGILEATDATPATTNFNIENAEADSYPAYFKGAGVYFDNVNKIYVKLNTTENVTLTVNGTEVAVEDTTVYTDGIKATAFADTITFVLSYDGEVMQTLTYSVNAYAYAKQNDTEMGTLALALYNYGLSAKAYQASLNA